MWRHGRLCWTITAAGWTVLAIITKTEAAVLVAVLSLVTAILWPPPT